MLEVKELVMVLVEAGMEAADLIAKVPLYFMDMVAEVQLMLEY